MTVRRQVRSPYLLIAIAIGLLVAAVCYARSSQTRESVASASAFARVGCGTAITMFKEHRSGGWLTISGEVERVLGDSNGRFEHQRFILRCTDGLTLLVVNDVSVGQRVPVALGGRVTARGQYVWDKQGGLVHFTHHSDSGPNGWILYGARVYQ